MQIDLHDWRGRSTFFTLLNEHPAVDVVVSLPAGFGTEHEAIAELFSDVLQDTGRDHFVFFLMDVVADSVNLLRLALPYYGSKRLVAVKNLKFGNADRFDIWDNSDTRNDFLNTGGREMTFPILAGDIARSTIGGYPPTAIC